MPAQAGNWHSQVQQDQSVAKIFDYKRSGYFVDLAANEPVYISNTRALERDFGWTGLCIDGNQNYVDKLVVQRTCSVFKAVVSGET